MRKIRKNIVILVTLNLIVFGLYFYLFMNIRRADMDTSSKLTQVKIETLRKERLQSIKSLMNETKSQRDKISNLFVQPDGSVEFMEMVESLGGTAGVKLNIESVGINKTKNETGSSTESLRLSVKVEGVWANVIHLLNLLENLPFKVSFNNVVLKRVLEVSIGVSPKIKEKPSPYWNGVFDFSVLKIKNPSQFLKK